MKEQGIAPKSAQIDMINGRLVKSLTPTQRLIEDRKTRHDAIRSMRRVTRSGKR